GGVGGVGRGGGGGGGGSVPEGGRRREQHQRDDGNAGHARQRESGVIVARQHSSARHGGEARRARPARHSQRKSGSCVPSPVYGGGTGRGHAKRLTRACHTLPTPPLLAAEESHHAREVTDAVHSGGGA